MCLCALCAGLSCCCSACTSFGGKGKGGCAKQMYWSIMFLTALASIAIYFGSMSVPPQAFYAYDTCNLTKVKSLSISSITDPAAWNSMMNTVTGTAKIAAAQSECVGNYSVYRLSFSLFAFFGTICLASLCTSAVHAGLWCVKIVAFFVLIVGTFFIPNEFFLGYEHFARVASCLFLVLQIVILVDFVYDLDEWLLEKIDPDAESEGKSCCKPGLWKVVYLVLSLAGIVVGLGGCIALFALYGTSTTGAGCTLNVVLVVITLLLWLVTTVLSICNCLGIERGILTPSAVFSYSTYMCYTALSSQNNTCNPAAGGTGTPTMVIGLIVAAVALTWTTARTTNSAPNLVRSAADQEKSSAAALEMREEKRDEKRAARRKKREEKRNKGDKDDKDDGGPLAGNELAHDGKGADDDTVEIDLEARNGDDKEDKDADKEAGKESVWFFHLVMALGAVYLAMLITKWKHYDPSTGEGDTENTLSLWVKVASQWMTYVFYLWTLLAPRCFPGRDFGDNHNSLKGY